MRRVADRLACAWAVRHPLRQEGCGPVHPGVQPSLVREHACMIEFCHAGVLVEAARGSQSSACCAWTGTQSEGELASPGQYPETCCTCCDPRPSLTACPFVCRPVTTRRRPASTTRRPRTPTTRSGRPPVPVYAMLRVWIWRRAKATAQIAGERLQHGAHATVKGSVRVCLRDPTALHLVAQCHKSATSDQKC